MNRFKITHSNRCKASGFGFLIELIPAGVKCKRGHWRTEFAESLKIQFMVWEFTIYFDLAYWEDYCEQKNTEEI